MQLLTEKSRQELIQKSIGADKTKSYGTTRWDRRIKIKTFDSTYNYDKIDMNAVFKGDMCSILIPVHGESNNYSVELFFDGICTAIKQELKAANYKLDYKVFYRAIIKAIQGGTVLMGCTCPDWKYRQAYWGTQQQYNAGKPELRPAKETNPNDTKGAGCKHVLAVLGELSWAAKLALCIYNYTKYMQAHFPEKFIGIIWKAISDKPHDQVFVLEPDSEGDLVDNTSGQYDDIRKANLKAGEVEYPVEDKPQTQTYPTYMVDEEPEDFDQGYYGGVNG